MTNTITLSGTTYEAEQLPNGKFYAQGPKGGEYIITISKWGAVLAGLTRGRNERTFTNDQIKVA